MGAESGVNALSVNGVLRGENGGNGLESRSEEDVFSVAYSSLYASAVIGDGRYGAVAVAAEDVVLLASA